MKAILKASLEEAIEKWIENCSEKKLIAENYDIFIHYSLVTEMTNAAESVFDCLVNFQSWQKLHPELYTDNDEDQN